MCVALIMIAVSLLSSAARSASGKGDVIGTWEGESKCAVADSPCPDDHARYRMVDDQKDPAKLSLLGYKAVNGDTVFMGRSPANTVLPSRL